MSSEELRVPTGYTGIYANWNVDIDGDDAADSPWHFGTSSEYPALKADMNGDDTATWQEFGYQLRQSPYLTASAPAGESKVNLTWTAVDVTHWDPPPALTYKLERAAADPINQPRFETLAEGQSELEYTDSAVTATNGYLYRVSAAAAGDGAAFHGNVRAPGRLPVAIGVASKTLRLAKGPLTVALSSAFEDPDGHILTYSASSSDTTVATVSLSGSVLTITPVAAGQTTITITAIDPVRENGSVSQQFTVTVLPATATDYDADDDGLIAIGTLAQLAAVRHDGDGDGAPTSEGAVEYVAAFGNNGNPIACVNARCIGYELVADLDFDTNQNGLADDGDAYWNDGFGWRPVGPRSRDDGVFEGVFEGNGRTISNLFSQGYGLFHQVSESAVVRRLGLINVTVGENRWDSVGGGVASVNLGEISTVFVTGRVSGGKAVGGLVGLNRGLIAGSYAGVRVSGMFRVGGLVGQNRAGTIVSSYATGSAWARDIPPRGASRSPTAGALVGMWVVENPNQFDQRDGRIVASYAAGRVTEWEPGSTTPGGLIGLTQRYVSTDSNDIYWDSTTLGSTATGTGSGLSTSDLQSPIGYTGIYSVWNVDLDGDGSQDDPWDFGTSSQYPALKADLDGSNGATWREFGFQLRAGPTLTARQPDGEAAVRLDWTEADVSGWSPAPSVTYTVVRDDGVTVEMAGAEISSLFHTDSDATPGRTHKYQVAAVVAGGEAAWSEPVEVAVTNQPPVAVGTLPPLTLRLGSGAFLVDVSAAFEDPERDALTIETSSSAATIVAARTPGSPTILTPWNLGAATITVKATDLYGLSATQAFAVTVLRPPGVTVTPDVLNLVEGSSSSYEVVLHSPPTGTVTVTPAIPADTDVTVNPSSLVFRTGTWDTPGTVTVEAARDGDTLTDPPVAISHTVAGGDYEGVSAIPVTVNTTDVNVRGVDVSETSLEVPEGSSGTYTVVLTSQPTDDVNISVSDSLPGLDVSVDKRSLRFTPQTWDQQQEVAVRVNHRSELYEEPVTVSHTVRGGDYGSVTAASVEVIPLSNDRKFGVSDPSAGEGDGTLAFRIIPRRSSSTDVIVDFRTVDGTATAGADYMATEGTLTFPAGTTVAQTVEVTLVDDSVDESDQELLLLEIEDVSPTDGGEKAVGIGVILDDDERSVVVSFRAAAYDVTEGSSVVVTAVLSSDPKRVVEIPLVKTHHGGATELDYSGLPASVIFTSGETSRKFTVVAVDDHEDDDGEAVVVGLGALPDGVTGSGQVTLAIRDNDGGSTGGDDDDGDGGGPPPSDGDDDDDDDDDDGDDDGDDGGVRPPTPRPTVSVAAAEASESAGRVVFSVRLSASSSSAVTVDYATAEGAGANGASAGADYTETKGTLTFPARSTAVRQIRVPVTDDGVYEPEPEMFWLTLRNPTNAALAGGGSVLRVVGTIHDDDGGSPTAAFELGGVACGADLCRAVTGEAVRFIDTSSGRALFRRWEFGDGGSSRGRRPEHAWSEPGFYEVTLWVSAGELESTASRKFLVEASEPAGFCVADAETLCLQDSRYAVNVDWWTAAGKSGAGSVVHEGTNDSGLFRFFNRENWEVLIKVLDGCALNGHVWVYGASTTDLGYSIRVTDTVTETVKEYRNEPGHPAPAITDGTAFPDGCRP